MTRRKATLNGLVLDLVESESITEDNTITNHPVEEGIDISDHARNEPSFLRISGTITEDAPNKLQEMRNFRKERILLKYTGRNSYDNLIIEKFDRDHGKQNRKGYEYNMTLQQIRITKAEKMNARTKNPKTNKVDPKTTSKTKKVVNRGLKQTKKQEVKTVNMGNTSPRLTTGLKQDPIARMMNLNSFYMKGGR